MTPRSIGIATVGVLAVLTLLLSFTIIPAGHVGVVRTLGAIKFTTLQPGLNMVFPWLQSVEHVDVRLSSIEANAGAASFDSQDIATQVAMQYSIRDDLVPVMINNLGDRDKLEKAILNNGIQESVKAATARYVAEKLITDRSKVKTEMTQILREFVDQALEAKDLKGLVQIANISITDFKFSREFNSAIEAKVRMQQEALAAENEQRKLKTQADTAAIQIRTAADAEAYRVNKEAESRAKAITLEGDALAKSPLVIRLRATEKWDGTLPRMTGSTAIPFINVDELGTTAAAK